MPEFVKVEIRDFVATVTLARPPVNALSKQTRTELRRAFDSFSERDDVRVAILTGEGKFFCAGADIKERGSIGEDPGAFVEHNRTVRETFNSIRECDKPVIAAVNGGALGAGFALAASCDILLAAEAAYFGTPEIDIGIAGGASAVAHLFSRSRLRRMQLTAMRMSAAELYRLGIVEECLPAGELLPAAEEIARDIASKSPIAVKYTKRCCNICETMPRREAHRLEQSFAAELAKTDDAKEARLAFVEKRPPVFKGR